LPLVKLNTIHQKTTLFLFLFGLKYWSWELWSLEYKNFPKVKL